MRLLVTRPQPEADRFARTLESLGHTAVVAPLLLIEPSQPIPPERYAAADAIAITSARALAALTPPATALDLPLYAVGDATAETARAAGFTKVEAAEGDARALAALLSRRLAHGSRLLHPSGADLATDLSLLLAEHGIAVERHVVYRAHTAERLPAAAADALKQSCLDAATFFSPRTAKTFVRLAGDSGLAARTATLIAFCLSPAVAAGLTGSAWREIHTAARPDRAGMLEIIESRSC